MHQKHGFGTFNSCRQARFARQLKPPEADAWQVVGSGWATYEAMLRAKLGAKLRHADGECYPQAVHVAEIAAREFAAGRAVPAEQALPVYLRDKVALTLVEQGKPTPAA